MFKAQVDRNNEILSVYRKNIGAPNLDEKLSELDNKPMFAPEDRKILERTASPGGSDEQQGQGGGGVVPPAAQAHPPQRQLDLAPDKSVATINGRRMIKQNGQWVPYAR
jgi:hypothetical protein